MSGRVDIVALAGARHGTRQALDYARRTGLSAEVFLVDDLQWLEAYGLAATPTTVLVSTDGRIEEYLLGAYHRELRSKIESYFGIVLPKLPSET